MRALSILGSTGSIGTQTLDVVRKHRDRFRVVALVAGRNAELLAQQADEFEPDHVVLAEGDPEGRFATGSDAIDTAAAHPEADVVVNALVGSRGLRPTLHALEAGKTVALANKESLVAGGDLVMRALGGDASRLLPVDSEHSALLQCAAAGRLADVRRVVITASGGPFRGRAAQSLRDVTVDEALAHPTWRMGRKNTIDSATMMNKALEAIEAHHLFGLPPERIEIVVHPRSIVHGIVEFVDGSAIVQAATPDMRLPIQVALAWPERLPEGAEPIDWASVGSLAFEPADADAFPAVALGHEVMRRGGTSGAVLNAANEEAVDAFLDGRIGFLDITRITADVLSAHEPLAGPSLDDVLEAERWARAEAHAMIARGE